MAYVYCSATSASSDLQTAASIIRCILRQLADTDQGIDFMKPKVAERIERGNYELTCDEAVDYILEVIEEYNPIQTTIIIDALDEIDSDHIIKLRTSLDRLLQGKGLLKIFVSSRPERWISKWLKSWQNIEVLPVKSEPEIKRYVDFEVNQRLIEVADADLKNRIKEVLKKRACGM